MSYHRNNKIVRNVPLVVVVVAVGIVVGDVAGGERGVVVVGVAGRVVVGEGGGRDLLEQLVDGRVGRLLLAGVVRVRAAAAAVAAAGTAHRAAGRGEARLVGGGRALLLPVELCLVNKRIL